MKRKTDIRPILIAIIILIVLLGYVNMLVLNAFTGMELYSFLLETMSIIISLICLSVIIQFKVKI